MSYARCYNSCRHYVDFFGCGYCKKYDLQVGKNMIHPFWYFQYYRTQEYENGPILISSNDILNFVNLVEKYIDKDNELALNIINYYRKYHRLSFKQRKALAEMIFHCYDEKPTEDISVSGLCYQVED